MCMRPARAGPVRADAGRPRVQATRGATRCWAWPPRESATPLCTCARSRCTRCWCAAATATTRSPSWPSWPTGSAPPPATSLTLDPATARAVVSTIPTGPVLHLQPWQLAAPAGASPAALAAASVQILPSQARLSRCWQWQSCLIPLQADSALAGQQYPFPAQIWPWRPGHDALLHCVRRKLIVSPTLAKVTDELRGYSDHKLHQLAEEHAALKAHRLPEAAVLQSGKFQVPPELFTSVLGGRCAGVEALRCGHVWLHSAVLLHPPTCARLALGQQGCGRRRGNAPRRAVRPEHCAVPAQVLAQLLPDLQAAGSRPLIFSQWAQVCHCCGWPLPARLPASAARAQV